MIKRTHYDQMPLLIILIAVFGTACFNSVSSVLSVTHVSTIFRAYSMILSVLALVMEVHFILSGMRFSHLSLCLLALAYIILLSFFVSGYGNSYANAESAYYCLWGIPSLVAGMVLSGENRTDCVIRNVDLLWPVLTIGSTAYIVRCFDSGWIATDATGIGYQSASYYAALAYGLNAYSILHQNDNKSIRYRWAQSRLFGVCSLVCLPLLLVVTFLSGGRGGLLEALVLSLLFASSLQSVTRRPLLMVLAISCLVIAIRAMVIVALSGEGMLGVWRLTAGSGRTEVYDKSWELICRRPILGYGFFGYVELIGSFRYPHNILLQCLLSCGVMGTSLLLVLFVVLLARLRLLDSPCLMLFVVLLVDALTRLSFSGSFIYDTVFMFCAGYLANIANSSRSSGREPYVMNDSVKAA